MAELQARGKKQDTVLIFHCPALWVDSLVLAPGNYPGLAKILTAFLAQKEKAYQITPQAENCFAVQSWHTIRPGSVMCCRPDPGAGGLNIYVDFVFQKVVSFRSQAYIQLQPAAGRDTLYVACWYEVPAAVGAAIRMASWFKGRNLLEGKVLGFWLRTRDLLDQLAGRPAAETGAKLKDEAELEKKYFPVRFSPAEKRLLQGLFGP